MILSRRLGLRLSTPTPPRFLSSLHPDWIPLATKELKGADPAEELTWDTPEGKRVISCLLSKV